MRAPRLFVAGPLEQAAEIALPAAAAQHVVSVLRLRPGAPLTLFDGRGGEWAANLVTCLLYTSPSPRDRQKSRMPSSA